MASQIGSYVPQEVKEVKLEDKSGKKVLNVSLIDQDGREFNTASLFDSKKPVIITPMYYTCPVVCSTTESLLIEAALRIKDLEPGKDYSILLYSFNHEEKPEDAKKKCKLLWNYLGEDAGVCAVGDSLSTWQLSQSLGFFYKKIKKGLYAHPVAVIVTTPDGRVSRAIADIGGFKAQDLRLALLEASGGKIGKSQLINSVLLYCYQYDSSNKRYNLVVWRVVKLFGIVTLAILGLIYGYVFLFSKIHEKK